MCACHSCSSAFARCCALCTLCDTHTHTQVRELLDIEERLDKYGVCSTYLVVPCPKCPFLGRLEMKKITTNTSTTAITEEALPGGPGRNNAAALTCKCERCACVYCGTCGHMSPSDHACVRSRTCVERVYAGLNIE